ncbi:hypothetical protein AGMMS50268_33030 [Spirochaetia bacterium]|nr:hypothetical protein AGMMS49546_16850 [Spirochaetia bacterium]GHV92800.1 hypothetical protein AGMMS50268_33030 [Spirochaetia bacterium]
MIRRSVIFFALVMLVGSFAFAQDLKIDFQYNVSGATAGNHLTYSGHRLVGVTDDIFDAVSGASKQKSTALITYYQTDVLGKAALPAGLRGLLLYPVAPPATRTEDFLTVSKAANGVITAQYVHRGTAYGIITDNTGKFTFDRNGIAAPARSVQRIIGYIQGAGPQVLHGDFLSSGRADYAKIWNAATAGGTVGSVKTGAQTNDFPDAASLFYYTGVLQFTLDQNILKIAGTLKPNKR